MAKDPADRYQSCEELVATSSRPSTAGPQRARWLLDPGRRSRHVRRSDATSEASPRTPDGRRGGVRWESRRVPAVRALPGPGRRLVTTAPSAAHRPALESPDSRQLRPGEGREHGWRVRQRLGCRRPFAVVAAASATPLRTGRGCAAERSKRTSAGPAATSSSAVLALALGGGAVRRICSTRSTPRPSWPNPQPPWRGPLHAADDVRVARQRVGTTGR